jgi:hypothetical protein
VYCLHTWPQQPLGQDLSVDHTNLDLNPEMTLTFKVKSPNFAYFFYYWLYFVIFEWIVLKLEHNYLQRYRLNITRQTLTFTHKWPWLWRWNYWNCHFFWLLLAVTLLLVPYRFKHSTHKLDPVITQKVLKIFLWNLKYG